MTELEAAVDKLHAVPLEDFVEERKRLAKELRAAGDRAAAAELAKLAKPSAPAWALNHLAREEPETIGGWLAAAETLRDVSERADRSSADELRAAIAAHREATRSLLGTVREKARPNGRELSEPMVDRVRDLLQAATVDPDAAERLRAGRVVEGGDEPADGGDAGRDERGGGDESRSARGGAAAAGKRGSKAKVTGGDEEVAEARAAKEREAREAAERAELERLVAEAEERLGALRADAEEAAEASARADERLEEAERTLHRSESEAAAARAAAGEAAEAAEQAERELRTLTAKLSS